MFRTSIILAAVAILIFAARQPETSERPATAVIATQPAEAREVSSMGGSNSTTNGATTAADVKYEGGYWYSR